MISAQSFVSSGGARRAATLHLLFLVAFAVSVRLLFLPYASQDTNDHTLRVWIAWRWMEDPFFFLHGHWPPLHFFLLGPVIHWTNDPLLAPVLVQVAFGSLVPVVLYLFSVREWGDRSVALTVGAAYALYPIAVRTSLEVLAQPQFGLFVALTFLALSHAREDSATWRQTAVAGAMLALAGMFRVEGWILIPFFALTLWPRWPHIILFAAVAALAPLAMMVANTLHYGNPLLPITTVLDYELDLAGRDNLSLLAHAQQVLRFLWQFAGGMTPALALLAGLGALSCLLRRERQTVWLMPGLAMGFILLASVARGSTAPKFIYTESLGLLLAPFLGSFLLAPEMRRLPRAATSTLCIALVGYMLLTNVIGTLRDIPGLRERNRLLAAIPALNPAPTFNGKPSIDRLLPLVRATDGAPGRGLIVDRLGSPASFYLGLQSLYHPDRIFIAADAPNTRLDARVPEERRPLRERMQPLRDSEPLELEAFLHAYCSGLLILQPGSRFAAWLDYREPDRASLGAIDLKLAVEAREPWPLPVDARLRAPGLPATAPGEVVLFNYRVEDCTAAGS